MRIIVIPIFILFYNLTFAQICENYDKSLFNKLPNNFPEKINCIDSLGKKTGWWINYKIKYNPKESPDELEKGNFVNHYNFGMYKDNFKVGTWKTIENIHLVYVKRIDNYYYSKDTILVTSEFTDLGWKKSSIYYNNDSSIINSSCLSLSEDYIICIECDKKRPKNEECIMTYKNSEIKRFPITEFDLEFYLSFRVNNRKIRLIDEEHN